MAIEVTSWTERVEEASEAGMGIYYTTIISNGTGGQHAHLATPELNQFHLTRLVY